jgi:hypothetical protein
MRTSHIQIRIGGPRGSLPAGKPGLLRKLAAFTLGAVALAGAFMISVVVLAVVATVGVVGGVYVWWRTRELRKRVAEQMRAREQEQGRVIEGEVVRNPD